MISALILAAALAVDGPKVLNDPLRVYKAPFVYLEIDVAAETQWVTASSGWVQSGWRADRVCKLITAPRTGRTWQHCTLWIGTIPESFHGEDIEQFFTVQACSGPEDKGGRCGNAIREPEVWCTAGDGAGCPCWGFFPNTDPFAHCDP